MPDPFDVLVDDFCKKVIDLAREDGQTKNETYDTIRFSLIDETIRSTIISRINLLLFSLNY